MEIVPAPPTAQAAALSGFRQAFHDTLDGWADALFELTDATICAPTPVASVREQKVAGGWLPGLGVVGLRCCG